VRHGHAQVPWPRTRACTVSRPCACGCARAPVATDRRSVRVRCAACTTSASMCIREDALSCGAVALQESAQRVDAWGEPSWLSG
jgi:hypothetical protein